MTLRVVGDHPTAADLLQRIAAICADHGAHWHPDLVIRTRDGQWSVHRRDGAGHPRPSREAAQAEDEALISLPTELLVPIDGAEWRQNGDQLELLTAPPHLSAVQQELLELHIALYNATGKLRWWKQDHPQRAIALDPRLATALQTLLPYKFEPQSHPPEGFLSTRSFRQKPPDKQGEHAPTRPVLLPLMDLLNHHHRGARFQVGDGTLQVACVQPGSGDECFASYGGRRDVLGLALHYGYCDHSTPFAYSAPLHLSTPEIGTLSIEGLRANPAHPLDPPQVAWTDSGLSISHLCCHLHHPERLQTVLKLPLQAALQRRGFAGAAAARKAVELMASIGQENVRLLLGFAQVVESAQGIAAGRAVLAAAVRRQASILEQVLVNPLAHQLSS